MCQGKNRKLIQDLTLKIISNIYLKHVGFTRIFCVINFFGWEEGVDRWNI